MTCGYSLGNSRFFLLIIKCSVILTIFALAATQAYAATITVPAGGSLQSAINSAQPGDTIIVEAGVVYTGDLVLPNKSGPGYITVQSSRVAELPDGVRVGPAQSALLARLQSVTTASPVIRTAAGGHHYRFIGVEIFSATSGLAYDLVRFGEWSQTADQIPHDIIIDRSWIHGWPTQDVQRGIALNGAEITVSNSSITDIHGRGYDTQAICGWNGPGPFHIINNYLEASGENILFGGADPSITNLVPTNIEIRRNHIFKPLRWKVNDPTYAGIHWTVKNLLELKMARNVVIDGNVLENSWGDAQIGYAVLFTVRNQDGRAPWAIIENVTFTNNIIKNSEQGIQTLGVDNLNISQQSNGLRIANNLFLNVGHWFTVVQDYDNVTVEHNTHFQGHNILVLNGLQSTGFVYRNNLTIRDPNGYGVFGSGVGEGSSALSAYCPSYAFVGNVMVGGIPSIYPSGNSFPATVGEVQLGNDYRLLSTSPYRNRGTDGKDPGVDVDALNAALAGVATTPTPTPTPSPSPTPTPSPSPTPTPSPSPTPTPSPLPVSITSPASNLTFNFGANINLNATASSPSGSITHVDFYDGSNLIGTSATAPYSVVWSNGSAGNHTLTAVARDNTGNSGTSSPIVVKISKALNGVRSNKRNTSTLTTDSSTSNVEASSFDSLVAGLEQTYYDFTEERNMFSSSITIDKSLFAALLLGRSSAALAKQSESAAIDDRLDKLDAYLSICEDLMVSGAVSNSTLIQANRVSASLDLRITQPIASPMSSPGILLQPLNAARLVVSAPTPFTTQTVNSPTGSYELAGLSVSMDGQSARITSVSPNEITFIVPGALWGGLADVVVTSREGYMSHGTAAVQGLYPRIFRWAGDPNDRGAVLDAISFQSTISPVSNSRFNLDGKSRMSIWATGISTGVANSDTTNDVILGDGRILTNVADGIRVEARLADGRAFLLPVEYAGPQGSMVGLDQINVVLVPELSGGGDVQLTVLIGLVRSNTLRIVVH